MADDDPTQASEGQAAGAAPGPLTRLGRYAIEGVLGAGATATVYLARDPTLDRAIALKVIRGDERAATRLVREGQALARVSHPNVIHVYEVGREPELVYVAMERIDGDTLHRWLETPRSRREILDVFAAAARGLSAAHAAGLVHRDFKPENVMVGRDGRVRVLDFGLARPADEGPEDAPAAPAHGLLAIGLTATGALTGTPAYMSPEQWRGEHADARSDQFSFCVALYRALAGRHPFGLLPDSSGGESRAILQERVEAGAIEPMPRGVPRRIERALRRGLAVRPADRHRSMDDVVAALTHRPRAWIAAAATGAAAIAAVVAIVALGGGSGAPRVTVYDAPSRITYRGDVGRAAASPDGTQVAMLTADALVVQPVAKDAEPRVLVRGRFAYDGLSWSPDGRALAMIERDGGAEHLVVVDVATGDARPVALAPKLFALLDGGRLVTTRDVDHALAYYDLAAPDAPVSTCPLPGTFSLIRALAVADGAIYVQVEQGDRASAILRVDPPCARVAPATAPLPILSFVVRGDRVFARLMDQHDLVEVATGAQHVVQSSEWTPLAIRADDAIVHLDSTTRWQLLDVTSGAPVERAGGPGELRLAFAPGVDLVAQIDGVYRDGVLRVGPEAALGQGAQVARRVVRAAWSPDGAHLAVLAQTDDGYAISLWDPRTRTMSEPRAVPLRYDAEMVWLDDHRVGVLDAPDWRDVRWIDPTTGDTGTLVAAPAPLRSIARAHAGDRLAVVTLADASNDVWLWRPDAPATLLAHVPDAAPLSARHPRIRWSADDTQLLVYHAGTGDAWSVDATTGAVAATPAVAAHQGGGFTSVTELFPLAGRTLAETLTQSADVYVSVPARR
jgi:hypothetical protein